MTEPPAIHPPEDVFELQGIVTQLTFSISAARYAIELGNPSGAECILNNATLPMGFCLDEWWPGDPLAVAIAHDEHREGGNAATT